MQLFARKRATQNNLNSNTLTIENGNSVYVYGIHLFQDGAASSAGAQVTIATSTGSETIFAPFLPANAHFLLDVPWIADKGLVISCNSDAVGASVYYSQVG